MMLMLRLVRACMTVRQPQRLFSCLKVKCSPPLAKLANHNVQRTCIRFIITPKNLRKFRPQYTKDKVSSDWTLIYENNINKLLFWSQSLIYLMIIPANVVSLAVVAQHISDIPGNLSISHPASSALAYLVFGSTLLGFVAAVSRRSILRIYRDPTSNRNIAIVKNWAMMTSKLEFEMKDCINVDPMLLKAWAGNVLIKGRPFYVFPGDFSLPKFYNQLRGWELDREIEVIKDIDIKKFLASKGKSDSVKKD